MEETYIPTKPAYDPLVTAADIAEDRVRELLCIVNLEKEAGTPRAVRVNAKGSFGPPRPGGKTACASQASRDPDVWRPGSGRLAWISFPPSPP